MKCYLVQTVDVWNNVTLHGVFKDLKLAESRIKDYYSYVEGIENLELREYVSTFGLVFDTVLDSEDDYIRVFGYILKGDESGLHLKYEEE